LTEFSEFEPRLLKKLLSKFKSLLESQKAKSVQYEVLQSVFKILNKNEEFKEI
jgi:hypothetical protein